VSHGREWHRRRVASLQWLALLPHGELRIRRLYADFDPGQAYSQDGVGLIGSDGDVAGLKLDACD
jgi:hypothetical protein